MPDCSFFGIFHLTRSSLRRATQITSGPNRFTDYFNLLKINGRWYVTDKVAFRQEL